MSIQVDIEKKLDHFMLSVSFHSENTVTGLLGASGCGKSMTLKCIAGIVKPDKGRIVLNDRVLFDSEKKINLKPQERKVGYLFQNYALFPNMTVEQNIACGLPHEKDKRKKKEIVDRMIASMRLSGLEKHYPKELSGGQQQRVALARILVGNPEILLLDEAFSALDSFLKDQLMSELKLVLKDFQKDTILVTHSRDEAYDLCENLAIMDQGKILNINEKQEVFDHPGNHSAAVLTGCKNIVKAEKRSENSVFVPEWNVEFKTDAKVGDDLKEIGIRAHFFYPKETENRNRIRIESMVEEPFDLLIKFRYEGQGPTSAPIWWRVSKDSFDGDRVEMLGVKNKDILLLY